VECWIDGLGAIRNRFVVPQLASADR
jgi:hypothetical protein